MANKRPYYTEDQVIEIRKRLASGATLNSLGEEFNVHLTTIHLIKHRKKWAHL